MSKPLLRDCTACGKEVSRHSAFCRHCGHPQRLPLVIWLLVLFLMMMIAFYMAFTIYGMRHVHELRVVEKPREEPAACLWRGVALQPVCAVTCLAMAGGAAGKHPKPSSMPADMTRQGHCASVEPWFVRHCGKPNDNGGESKACRPTNTSVSSVAMSSQSFRA